MTQGPLTNTVDDFWRMVWEHRASAIVMLCSLVEDGKVRYYYSTLLLLLLLTIGSVSAVLA